MPKIIDAIKIKDNSWILVYNQRIKLTNAYYALLIMHNNEFYGPYVYYESPSEVIQALNTITVATLGDAYMISRKWLRDNVDGLNV